MTTEEKIKTLSKRDKDLLVKRVQAHYHEKMKAVAESGEDLQNNYTPEEICNMLLDKIQLDGNKSILVLYNIEIVFQLWKRRFSGKLTFFTSSEEKSEFAKKLFPDVCVEYIALEENPIHYLEMKKWPDKFDIIVSNPPYSKKLDLKFLDKAVDLAEEQVVFVHPSSFLVDNKGNNKFYNTLKNKIKNYLDEIEFFNGNGIFNINLFVPCSITSLNKKKNKDQFVFKFPIYNQNILLHKEKINNISIFGVSNEIISFKEKIKDHLNNKSLHEFGVVLGVRQEHKKVLKKENSFLVEFTHIRGHTENQSKDSMVKDDFFTIISKNTFFTRGKNPRYNIWFEFKTEKEAINFISYLKTDFARMCLATVKTNQHMFNGELKFIPAVDFTQEWTDEKLYAHFNITEEEQAFIKAVIPPYYD